MSKMWLMLLLLLLLGCGPSFQADADCKPTRECSMREENEKETPGCFVDCSHVSNWDSPLEFIPSDLPMSTVSLNLNDNKITVVNATSFTKLTSLQNLTIACNRVNNVSSVNVLSLIVYNLRRNEIAAIDMHTFSGLKNLTSLHLDYNNIEHIVNGSFDELTSLKVLNLKMNRLSFTDYSSVPYGLLSKLSNLQRLSLHENNDPDYRGDIVANLINLQELHLDGPKNQSATFPYQFLNLRKLDKLTVYGKMAYVTNATFVQLSNCPITQLALASGRLLDLEPGAFKPLKNLKILSLSGNQKLTLCNVSHTWHGLNGSPNLTQLYLDRVMNSYSNEAHVPCNFFRGLNKEIVENIQTLSLARNNLVQIDKQFIHLKSLEIFSLNFNRMQKVRKIVCWASSSLINDRFPLPCYPFCDRNKSCPGNFSTEDGVLHIPASVKHIRLSVATNYNLSPMPKLEVVNCASLQILEMNDNAIGNLIGPIIFKDVEDDRTNNITVSLQGNFATALSPDFINDTRIKTLLLRDNNLDKTLWQDEEGVTFSKFHFLEVLDLSANMIKTLPPLVFSNLTSLKILNLSSNALSSIDFKMESMPNLEMLDFKENRFVTLFKDDMEALDARGNLTIFLENNPLVCSCENLKFLLWLKDFGGKTKKPGYWKYQCHYQSWYVHLGWFFEKEFDRFYKDCYSRYYLIASCICFAVMCVSLTTAITSYKFRWDIKFFCSRLIYRKEWKELSDSNEMYEYDAFIAYHEDDFQWVRYQLLHHFEVVSVDDTAERPLKLCVHDRDFLPGKTPEENISESIQRSFKTVIVLSKSFVGSAWCKFELHLARVNSFEKKTDNIVVVVLEPVPLRLMSTSLQILLRRTTFIEWPYSHINHGLFWHKLKTALKAPCQPVLCQCGNSMKNMWASSNRTNDRNNETT